MKTIRNRLVNTIIAVSIGFLIIGLTSPVTANDQQALVDRARITFESFMGDPNMSWLHENLPAAKGLVIVPSLLKAGFIFGGSGGSGVLIVPDAKTGKWSQPAFYTIGSVTFGLQIGGEAAEVIMYARTQKAVDRMLTSRLKFGGDRKALDDHLRSARFTILLGVRSLLSRPPEIMMHTVSQSSELAAVNPGILGST